MAAPRYDPRPVGRAVDGKRVTKMLFVYQPGDSFMHRMDAVSKLIWLVSITLLVVVATRAVENIAFFVWLLLVALVLARLPFFLFIKRVLPLTVVGVWLLVVMSLLYPRGATYLTRVGPLILTVEGLDYGLALFFRVMCLGSASIIFALTTEPRRMINELVEIGHLPYRWAYALYAALRFVPLLQTEAANIMNAHAVRGAVEKKTFILDVITPLRRLTVPLLVGGIRRVQITAIAMDSRAFGAYPKRTNIEPIYRPMSGLIFSLAHIVAFVIFFVWRVVLGGSGLLVAPIIR